MFITEVTINNYKSIGNENNTLNLSNNSTALIGKNESGKSNVLEAIGNLPYYNKPNRGYFSKNKNRRLNDDISIVIKMQLNEDDFIKFNVSNRYTKFTFWSESKVSIEGALSEIIAKDSDLATNIEKIIKTKGNRKIWNIGNYEQNRKQHDHFIGYLEDCSSLILLNFESDVNSFKKILIRSCKEYEEVSNTIDNIFSILSKYFSLIPKIFYRKQDSQLGYSYDLEQIKEGIQNKSNIFYRLMIASGISEDEMMRAFTEKIEGERQNIRWEIQEKITENIGKGFNEFYSQESIKFRPLFENNTLKFIVKTNEGKAMMISERSNGLRWYLSLFIDILANNFEESSVLFLFDEPGVHLHVNAQKELLSLFDDLCKDGNQVIYTTHSPSMIDGDNILNVRVVEKKDDGDTLIFNSSYDQRLSSDSKMETLSPLIKAIGADLKFNLGPQFYKQNLITEGITDYMYVKALLYHLNVIDPPNIIPSTGVDNINRIASILIGWGCDFKILLDYDNQGRREYNVLTEKLDYSLSENIVFVNGKTTPSLDAMKTSPKTIENLISELDKDKLTNKIDKDDKTLVAKEFYDKVISERIIPEEQTSEAFKTIFKKLGIPITKNTTI